LHGSGTARALFVCGAARAFLVRTFIIMHDCADGSFLPRKRANASACIGCWYLRRAWADDGAGGADSAIAAHEQYTRTAELRPQVAKVGGAWRSWSGRNAPRADAGLQRSSIDGDS